MPTLNKTELEVRHCDTIFGSEDLETLCEIPNYPVYMGCTEENSENDIFAAQSWQISRSTGVLQLKYLVPLDLVYLEQHNDSYGKTWNEHHQRFSNLITSSGVSRVLEVGGATGRLASLIDTQSIKWEIIEPNSTKIPGVLIHNRFFDEKFTHAHINEYEAVVHSHCFEHMYNPLEFLENCKKVLKADGKMIFSVPNMHEMLKRKYTNCINFEHTYFLPEKLIDYLLEVSMFEVIKKEYYRDDHSIFYTCIKRCMDQERVKPAEEWAKLSSKMYIENKQLFGSYIEYHRNVVESINREISGISEDINVYLFGAHVFSQFLIFNGLRTSRIKCILDNSNLKTGKRLYGTSLYVSKPSILAHEKNPIVILKAGPYDDEIKADILESVNASTRFV